MLIIEATAVTPDGRISPYDLGLYSDENEAGLRMIVDAIRQNVADVHLIYSWAGRHRGRLVLLL